MNFFKQRVVNVLSDKGYRKDIINSIVEVDFDNLLDVEKKTITLEEISKESGFEDLVNLVKRVENISKNHQNEIINEELLKDVYEVALNDFSIQLEKDSVKYLNSKKYTEYLLKILDNKDVINNFFDNVMVMDKNEEIKENRLSLLNKLYKNISKISDIKLID